MQRVLLHFELNVSPPSSGVTHGSITFTAPNGHYVWFTLEVHATPPPEEDVLKLEVPVRRAVTMQITLANPLATSATFKVGLVQVVYKLSAWCLRVCLQVVLCEFLQFTHSLIAPGSNPWNLKCKISWFLKVCFLQIGSTCVPPTSR